MRVSYQSSDGRLRVEVDEDKPKDVFAELARFQEVFENLKCGKCGHDDVQFVVRNVDDNDFYEIHCKHCRARFAFGQHKGKEGTLFPRRKDGEGNWLPDGGWLKYNPETGREE